MQIPERKENYQKNGYRGLPWYVIANKIWHPSTLTSNVGVAILLLGRNGIDSTGTKPRTSISGENLDDADD